MSVPHLQIPFELYGGNGPAATVEQNSIDEVTQCVEVLLATEIGSRVELPGYGIPDQTFSQRYDTTQISKAVAAWEPRAAVTVTALPGPSPQITVTVSAA